MKFFLSFLIAVSPMFGHAQTVGKQVELNSAWGIDFKSNLVKNPSAAKNASDITGNSGAVFSRDTTAGNMIDGKASVSYTLEPGEAINFDLLTPSSEQTNGNCEFKGLIKTASNEVVAAQITDGSNVVLNTVVIPQTNSQYRAFSLNYPCGASGARKVRILNTHGISTGTGNVGAVYYGVATNIDSGTPPNTFVAISNSAGVVLDENIDFINGNFVVSGTSIYTVSFNAGVFTQAPVCVASPAAGSFTAGIDVSLVSSTQLVIRTSASNVASAASFRFTCTKTGADFVQPAITPQNYDYSGQDCTITGNWSTNTTYVCKESRKGRWATYDIFVNTSGAPTAATNLILTLPSGRVIDTVVLATTLPSTAAIPADSGTVLDTGVGAYPARVAYLSSTTVAAYVLNSAGTYAINENITNLKPHTFGASDQINLSFSVPIVGWTETQGVPQLAGSVIGSTTVSNQGAAGVTTVQAGTYSATLTNVSNATSITSPATCNYLVLGSTVSVSCPTSFGCTTAAGTNTQLSLTLPVATTQGSTIHGTMGLIQPSESGRVGNTGNLALVEINCQVTGANGRKAMFMYQVP